MSLWLLRLYIPLVPEKTGVKVFNFRASLPRMQAKLAEGRELRLNGAIFLKKVLQLEKCIFLGCDRSGYGRFFSEKNSRTFNI